METNAVPEISLLWPDAKRRVTPERDVLVENAWSDLGIHTLLERLDFPSHLRSKMRAVLLGPVCDVDTIRYRQDVLEDFLNNPRLLDSLSEALPKLAHLGFLSDYPFQTYLEQVTARLGELEHYVDCVRMLSGALAEDQVTLRSAGLLGLRELLRRVEEDAAFRDLADRLPELRKSAAAVASVSIGINLDAQLRPYEATLLSINDRPFTGGSDTFLSRLFSNTGESIGQDFRGIARLHSLPADVTDAVAQGNPAGTRFSGVVVQLFQDLDHLLRRTTDPVARALKQYVRFQSGFLGAFEQELAFYLSGARLVEKLRAAGLPMCRAEIAPLEERVFEARDLYNLNLALQLGDRHANLSEVVVTNDARMDEAGRILILTGPNQGGKTTFTQAIGLAQALFQVGFFVPAREARISPADGILTLFPLEERPQANVGRLGEEAQRLSKIFKNATRHSLVLLNEALTTTSPGESIYLSRDILRALRLYGVRAIFVTHLHELAENIDALHASSSGDSRIASLVAGVDETSSAEAAEAENADYVARRTFKIRPAPPMGVSFAKDIARRHGISFEQLEQEYRERQNGKF